ncbi:hypothetical protein NL676_028545 [Syzygium grande]|nr:hypothetical protein NL676_028545 [Syzygium grande]
MAGLGGLGSNGSCTSVGEVVNRSSSSKALTRNPRAGTGADGVRLESEPIVEPSKFEPDGEPILESEDESFEIEGVWSVRVFGI